MRHRRKREDDIRFKTQLHGYLLLQRISIFLCYVFTLGITVYTTTQQHTSLMPGIFGYTSSPSLHRGEGGRLREGDALSL